MRAPRRIVAERPWLAVTLVVAGLAHIASVLALPRLAENDAFARLAPAGALNGFHVLTRAAPGAEIVPYADPAVASAVCRFDLAAGPLHVRGKLFGDGFVSLSFHSRHGTVFYALTDTASTRQAFDIFVVTDEQLHAMQAKDAEDEPPQELRLIAPSRKGFVFARALSPMPSTVAQATAQVEAMSCAIEPAAAR